jgi:hypothetical protein
MTSWKRVLVLALAAFVTVCMTFGAASAQKKPARQTPKRTADAARRRA